MTVGDGKDDSPETVEGNEKVRPVDGSVEEPGLIPTKQTEAEVQQWWVELLLEDDGMSQASGQEIGDGQVDEIRTESCSHGRSGTKDV